MLGLDVGKSDFDKLDENGGGYILFEEFVSFLATKQM
jgi:hypothetical protein